MTDNKTIIDEDDEIVTLTFDDGSQEEFFVMAELDYEGKWYSYLVPVDPDEDFADDEVLVYEIGEGDDGEEVFLPIEDDDLLDKLVEMLNNELEKDDK